MSSRLISPDKNAVIDSPVDISVLLREWLFNDELDLQRTSRVMELLSDNEKLDVWRRSRGVSLFHYLLSSFLLLDIVVRI